MTQDECKEIAEWYFKKKVVKLGIDYIQFANGDKVIFMPDADANLMEALEERMIEQAELDFIGINFSRHDPENRVRISYYKLVTKIGTTYFMSASGSNVRDVRVKALLKYIRKNTVI